MINFLAYLNPYSQTDFFQFFNVLFQRLMLFVTGQLSSEALVADEIQMIVLVGLSSSCALVGSFLVLRRMTMLANALSHTILLGIVVAYLLLMLFGVYQNPQEALNLQVLLIAAIITGVVTTFFTEFLVKSVKLQEDASIGIVFTTFFALGIVLITLFTRNVHVGTELVMGNVDALHVRDIRGVYWVLLLNVFLFGLFFKEFKITTFDSGLSRTLGFPVMFFNYLLMILTSATAIGGFRAVGVLMILAFLVGPVLTARLLTHRLINLIFISIITAIAASVIGIGLSRHILTMYGTGLSTGGLIVCVIVLFYVLAIIFSPQQGLITIAYQRKKIKLQTKSHL